MPKLTALSVKNAKPGRHGDGEGLYLLVKPTGAKSWVLRIQADGKRHDIGLGSVDTAARSGTAGDEITIPILQRKVLTLAEAREKAGLLRTAAKSGLDPIEERDRERRKVPTFREAAVAAHASLQNGWTDKNAKAFLNSLEAHAYPTLGKKRVHLISPSDIITTLEPIWTDKPQIAKKVRQRIGTVLNFAHAKGWRPTEAPQQSIGKGLPKQPKGGHYDVMPYQNVPAWVASLRARPATQGRRGQLLQIYTASRPGEVRGAQWGQFDLENRLWHRPASLMKEKMAHTVTLNSAAIELLERIRAELGREPKPTEFVVPMLPRHCVATSGQSEKQRRRRLLTPPRRIKRSKMRGQPLPEPAKPPQCCIASPLDDGLISLLFITDYNKAFRHLFCITSECRSKPWKSVPTLPPSPKRSHIRPRTLRASPD